ncbi:cytochrome-c oxidase, cbb3-type subunit III [Litorimonas sp. RW-G-Af-16]|uniref:cytochrome-c oxidase, cbb3-type subunit III n=1 Tax=Litorimonas sp. RW-G-Af-16 TaxID=3241168 RepID=UPI00390CBC18
MSDGNKNIDEISGTETTGHEWDGIEELNTPMPRWWLGLFYLCILWAIGYAILMPSIPFLNSHFKGLLGYSDRAAVAMDVEAMDAQRYSMSTRLTGASLEGIQADPDLFRFAMAAGKSSFGNNCATCHGSGGQGFKGYPNLNDDIWLWGGTFDQIRHTLVVGIRAEHAETQANLMQAYGRDGLLDDEQIDDLAEYLLAFNSTDRDSEAVLRGRTIFAEQCVSCHGENAKGDQSQGAPNLTDNYWLYGGTKEDIVQTLYGGRQGVMPNWDERLSPETITALAVYVHSLGGGVDTPSPSMPVDGASQEDLQ